MADPNIYSAVGLRAMNAVDELKQRILRDGRDLGGGILKVDAFLNHQVDPELMAACGRELARRFAAARPTKVLTAEISGIAPAIATAMDLGVPLVYARKTRPITMPHQVYLATAPSHTKGALVELIVSPEYLPPSDRVLIIDDFLATGHTILGLARLAAVAGATLVGVGAVVEKAFEGGRAVLAPLGVPVEALAIVTRMTCGLIELA